MANQAKMINSEDCSVCLEQYKEPKLLPCLHAFCKSPCLEKLVIHNRQGSSLCCPMCRYHVPLSEGGVAGLQSFNFQAKCDNCTKDSAQVFCRDCQKRLCRRCTKTHNKWKDFAEHEIVSLAEVTADATNLISRDVNMVVELVHSESQTSTPSRVRRNENDKNTISYTPTLKGRYELRVSVDGAAVNGSPFPIYVAATPESLGQPSLVIKGVKKPWGVATDSRGHIIVAEYGAHRVSLFNREGRKIRSFGEKGLESGQLIEPRGVAVDSDDNIYTIEGGNNQIQKYSTDGEFINSVGGRGSGCLQFKYPCGVGYNKTNDKIYIADKDNHRIQVLHTDLTYYKSIGRQGTGDGELKYPEGVSFDDRGNVYIAEYNNHRVHVFTAEGEFVCVFGSKGTGPGQLSYQRDVAVCADVVCVTEGGGNRVSMFSTTGEFIRSFGKKGREEGEFDHPEGIAIDDDANIIVADKHNNRIQVF